MGILKDGLYINCNKITKRERHDKTFIEDGVKEVVDTLFFYTMVNIFDSIAKENKISIWLDLECPYQESISDTDIYNLLKTKVISYNDAFGRKIEIDLTEETKDC
ncbi:MAG: hypothetical protein M0R03_03680 [Novosphingobium sp.]|nr:hypothetical protein [Novosphingobium sp.]